MGFDDNRFWNTVEDHRTYSSVRTHVACWTISRRCYESVDRTFLLDSLALHLGQAGENILLSTSQVN